MGIFDVFKKQEGESDTDENVSGAPKDDGKSLDGESDKRLLFFYGEECPHCHKIMPRIEEVEKALGVTFERFEVWHDKKNGEMLKKYDQGKCGGVPYLYNTASKDWICGAVETEKIHTFASKG